MTPEEAKQYLQTRQLTDYREDWPNGQKGCLFFVGFDLLQNSWNRCELKIVDFHWRKGANWCDYPKLFPYEAKCIQSNNTNCLGLQIVNFGAFLLAYMVEHESPNQLDLQLLWDTYLFAYSNINNSPVTNEYLRFSNIMNSYSKDISEKLNSFNIMKDSNLSSFFKMWETAISNWIDKFVAEMTPEKQLFNCCLYFKVNAECSYDVPVYVYDVAEQDYLDNVRCDSYSYYEDGTETYYPQEVLIGYSEEMESLVFKYNIPDSYDKKAIEFDYDEDDESFTAISFEEEFSDNWGTTEESLNVRGLTALILSYSAVEMIIKAYKSNNKWHSFSKLFCRSDDWCIEDINICITQPVYDTYFSHFCKKYENSHITDSDFFVLPDNEKKVLLIEKAIEDENEKIKSSTTLFQYLTEEQSSQLRKDVQNYIKYLEKLRQEIAPTSQSTTSTTSTLPPAASTQRSFDSVIQCSAPKSFLKLLHKRIDGSSPKDVGLILRRAIEDKSISDIDKQLYESEFVKNCPKWDSIRKYITSDTPPYGYDKVVLQPQK